MDQVKTKEDEPVDGEAEADASQSKQTTCHQRHHRSSGITSHTIFI
jgi:hypothetical protein